MINFITKGIKGRMARDYDLTISVVKKNVKKAIHLSFHNSSYKKIADIGEYIQIGFDDNNRLYFKKSDAVRGYKLIARSQFGAFVQIPFDDAQIGYRSVTNLKYDDTEGLYYANLG